jgi:isoamylase
MLLLAQGTPMLCAGDEIGRTQQGNNNAYCQDNAVSWLDWSHADTEFITFVASVLALRRSEPALHHDRWFQPPPCSTGERSLSWATPAGREMQLHDWHDAGQHAFTCLIDASQHDAGHGARHHLVIAFNPGAAPLAMRLPVGHWQVVLDSSGELALGSELADNGVFDMPERALVVLREQVRDKPAPTAT